MAKKENLLVGLDIGTTKVCAAIAQLEEEGGPRIVGLGSTPSQGLKRGVVVNLNQTSHSIGKAIQDAELMSGQKIKKVMAGIAGDHIRSLNSRGVVAVSNSDNEIKIRDVHRVLEAAKSVAIPQEREVIHVLPQEFTVDDQTGIKDPIGMCGLRLEAEVHIVTGGTTSAQNIYKAIWQAGWEVDELVLESLASSYAVMSPEEKELGAIVVDLGGGTADLAIFYDGSIRHTAVIGLGGNNVTNDLAIGLRTPVEQAEILKRNYGCALSSLVDASEIINVPGVGGRPSKEVSRAVLASIIEPRMEEIFSLALREVKRTNLGQLLAAGVIITGGGALLEGSVELAEQIFDMPARLGTVQGCNGIEGVTTSPVHATAIGLVLYGLNQKKLHLNGQNGKRPAPSLVGRIKDWFKEYF
jgi:cell division protein FtsA